jgi:hypothetical protein
VPKKIEAEAAVANCRALLNQINAGLSAEKTLVNVSSAAALLFYLEFAASCCHKVRATAAKATRTREIVGLTNERDFPYLVELELALPPKGFRSIALQMMRSTVNGASQSAAAGVDTSSSNSIFDSASQTLPLRMHSAIALVANA